MLFLAELYFAFFSGCARGNHHAWRDCKYDTLWTTKLMPPQQIRSYAWYMGSGKYNQSWPWTADFCHLWMHIQVIFLALAGIIAGAWQLPWYLWAIRLWAWWWIEGRGFTLFYHVILPTPKRGGIDYSFTEWLKGWVTI